jgi:glutathione S-transferase
VRGICRRFARFAWLERHLGGGPYFAGERFSLVDAALAPLLRYVDSFEQIADFGFFADAPKVRAYRAALPSRPSVQGAVVADYPARLMAFLLRRPSHLASLIPARAA